MFTKRMLALLQCVTWGVNIFCYRIVFFFFQTDILRENNVQFDEKIKPNFEDGKFLAGYLLCAETGNVVYLRKAEFFYRKRGNGISTIDG